MNNGEPAPEPRPERRPSAFVIDSRIELKLDIDFAVAVSDHILSIDVPNPAIYAFAKQLQNLAPAYPDNFDEHAAHANIQ